MFLTGAIVRFAGIGGALEPGEAGIAVQWALLYTFFSLLCFANLRARGAPGRSLAFATLAALLVAAALLVTGGPATRWIGGLSCIPFAATLTGVLLRRRRGV